MRNTYLERQILVILLQQLLVVQINEFHSSAFVKVISYELVEVIVIIIFNPNKYLVYDKFIVYLLSTS